MATILPPMQFVPAQWFTAAGDAALSGGVLKFYEVGTTTPKEVFADYLRSTSIGSEVTLDAGGRAAIFLDGLYRVALYNSLDELVSGPIDGIGGGSTSGEGSTLFVSLYDDLRALDGDDERAAVVEGRAANGDGGAGLFVWDALETADDDGGTILAPLTLPASGRWVRVRDPGSLSPRWYGVTADGTTDDRDSMGTALAASIALGAPVVLESGLVRLGASLPVSSGASIRVLPGAGFTGASGVVLGLPSGTKFEGCDDCFRGDLTASFGVLVADPSPSWWDRASEDDQIALALASVTANGTRIIIDRAYTLGAAIVMAAEPVLSFRGDGRLVWNSGTGLNIVIQKWEQDGEGVSRFNFGTKARLTSLIMSKDQGRPLSPRLFGAAGGGSSDDTFAVWPAFLHGWVDVDGRFQVNSTLTAVSGKSVVWNGQNPSANSWNWSEDFPSEIILGDGVSLGLTSATARQTSHRVAFRRPTWSASLSTLSNLSAVDCLFASDASEDGAPGIEIEGAANDQGGISLDRCRLRNVVAIGGAVGPNSVEHCVSDGDAGDDAGMRGLSGSTWQIHGSTFDASGAFTTATIADSTISAHAAITMIDGGRIDGSTILQGAAGHIVSGSSLRISGGAIDVPVVGSAGDDIQVSAAMSRFSWNGRGDLVAVGPEKIGEDGDLLESEQRDAMRATAARVDGVDSPYLRRHDLTTGPAVITASTTGWSFGASLGSPSVVSSRFEWAGAVTPGTSHDLTRTITTDEEKILSALGGWIDVEWTGDCNLRVQMVKSSSGLAIEGSGKGGMPPGIAWGSTAQRLTYCVWPGSKDGSDLVDRIKITVSSFTADNIAAALSIKVTVRSCAPLDAAQWVQMWGGDRSLSGRYNSWRMSQSGAAVGGSPGNLRGLECWVETLPNSPFTPRPETVQPWLLLQVEPLKLWPLMLAPMGTGESNATQPIYSWKGAGGTGFRTRTGGEG